MLPAQDRCKGIVDLITQKHYFVIHAARQSGKTTLLQEIAQHLNAAGSYYAVYCSLETVQGISEPERGIPAIVDAIATQIEFHPLLNEYPFAEGADYARFTTILRKLLSKLCQKLNKPLVMLFDEVDCLSNGTLISFLRQLRDGYVNRGTIPFIHSVALVGMRNIRDYKGKLREERETLGSASPFNIVSDTLTLRNFTRDDIERLYAQHTEHTGQAFPTDVVDTVYAYTQGQPWLVNAIAREMIVKMLDSDYGSVIAAPYVEEAVQRIILRRDTHIDSLMERLKEDRVRKVVEPVLIGKSQRYDVLDDDYQYVLDLGLLTVAEKQLAPSNAVYADVIVRTLNFRSQQEFDDLPTFPGASAYIHQGMPNMKRLLQDFQQFWRENSAIWIERFEYKEAAPHLILQAFLQRVVNSGGRIVREMASGRGRLDLCIHFQDRKYPLELKLRYSDNTEEEGQTQLAGYMDTLGCAEGWLLMFDRRSTIPWDEKIFWRTYTRGEKTLHSVGC